MKPIQNHFFMLPFLAIGMLLFTFPGLKSAYAEGIVKWIDANGRINYGAEAPSGARVVPLKDGAQVMVVPGYKPPPQPPVTQQQLDANTARIQELERKLAVERSIRVESELAEEEERLRRAKLRAECEERHRTTCTEDGIPIESRVIVTPPVMQPPPVVVVVPPTHPHHPETSPIPVKPEPPPKPSGPPANSVGKPSSPGYGSAIGSKTAPSPRIPGSTELSPH